MNHLKNDIADADPRKKALDPSRSFIIQAPAGSGKTELLIQRYLKLLGTVDLPEEIIAITFTRKAAAEMRHRVLEALDRGKNTTAPGKNHEKKTWNLAKAALAQDQRLDWQILQNPSRLKIQTIDALCAGLTRQMPYISQFGAQPNISDMPEKLYQTAARNTVADLESGFRWSPSIEALVRYLDNHLAKVEDLVADMLARRDQWRRHILHTTDLGNFRQVLEQTLADVIQKDLHHLRNCFPLEDREMLFSALRFAADNLKKAGAESLICACGDLTDLPDESPDTIQQWLGIAEFLLTQNGTLRKTVNKKNGFPPPSSVKGNSALKQHLKDQKAAFLAYLDHLDDDMAEALHHIRRLPDAEYTDAQWDIMQALFEILQVAMGHLRLVFQAAGEVDFSEISIRAAQALGEPDDPTDLSLSMDYRIRHILMDEFQDTSLTQYELLERLTAGWMPDDGRTLFAVGDPMQSIYAFREAEVGLFLNAWENGLPQVPLTPLTLSVNFRSQQGIIEWVNENFPKIMPHRMDISTGRVPYASSAAFHARLPGKAVRIYPFLPPDRIKEAESVVNCIKKAKTENPDGSIAVLVRSRSHLIDIVGALKREKILFQAVEIDSLHNRPVIMDLISLSRALSHPADRIAWLAVLRAPWCGLLLKDLHTLVKEAPHRSLIELMQSSKRLSELSADAQKRLTRVRDILIPAVKNRQRKPFRRLVEGVWLSLGGPACVFEPSELADAAVFFDLLEQQTGNAVLSDFAAIETLIGSLFARPDTAADETLQIMTIHKAKGLEFDTVILPGLERKPPPPSSQLMIWLERVNDDQKELLLAPISETGSEKNKIYAYIHQVQEEKRAWEDTRLLYVAVTRAKKYLHIMGGVKISAKDHEIKPPVQKSLLKSLWPAVNDVFHETHQNMHPDQGMPEDAGDSDAAIPDAVTPQYIRRLSEHWHLPLPPADVIWTPKTADAEGSGELLEIPEFEWAGETARHVGTVAHVWLKVMAETPLHQWNRDRIRSMERLFAVDLACSGVGADHMDDAVKQVSDVLINTLCDEKGRWILDEHKNGACEYALTGRVNGNIVSVKIDRTFVDENNIRWIIDYKTGIHAGGSLDAFLDSEKLRYQDQLELYKALMRLQEKDREIRMGLYFPQIRGWRCW